MCPKEPGGDCLFFSHFDLFFFFGAEGRVVCEIHIWEFRPREIGQWGKGRDIIEEDGHSNIYLIML